MSYSPGEISDAFDKLQHMVEFVLDVNDDVLGELRAANGEISVLRALVRELHDSQRYLFSRATTTVEVGLESHDRWLETLPTAQKDALRKALK